MPQNDFTRPLTGRPCYRSQGIIKVCDRDMTYAVSTITYERYDDQNFQYVFTPIWSIIDALPPAIFSGIPCLELAHRLERYYRVNMTPVFITERTPGTSREDVWELMERVGLDYYDRFEWLLRSDVRCGTDNLIVDRLPETGKEVWIDQSVSRETLQEVNCKDRVRIQNLKTFSGPAFTLQRDFTVILQSGAKVYLEEEKEELSEAERCAMLRLLIMERERDRKVKTQAQLSGIAKAKDEGKYKGRKRIEIDETLMDLVFADFDQGKTNVRTAMERLGLSSRSTFYRRLAEYREKLSPAAK